MYKNLIKRMCVKKYSHFIYYYFYKQSNPTTCFFYLQISRHFFLGDTFMDLFAQRQVRIWYEYTCLLMHKRLCQWRGERDLVGRVLIRLFLIPANVWSAEPTEAVSGWVEDLRKAYCCELISQFYGVWKATIIISYWRTVEKLSCCKD